MRVQLVQGVPLLFLLLVVSCESVEWRPLTDPVNRYDPSKDSSKITQDRYIELRRQGYDEVAHTTEAAAMRKYVLRKNKRKGLFSKQETDLTSLLFPEDGSGNTYHHGEKISIHTGMIRSNKSKFTSDFNILPACPATEKVHPANGANAKEFRIRNHLPKNLGTRLQGFEPKESPYDLKVGVDIPCTPVCQKTLDYKMIRRARFFIRNQYRAHMSLDGLPLLMRSQYLNYAVRGHPIGFVAPPSFTGLPSDEIYLYNHLKFKITYTSNQPIAGGVQIVGFDVHPVSIRHEIPAATGINATSMTSTCNAPGAREVQNHPDTYLSMTPRDKTIENQKISVLYSYEVTWIESQTTWKDRWDIFLLGQQDVETHLYAIFQSSVVVLLLTGMVSLIMIRTLRNDIAGYNEIESLRDETSEGTGWKLVKGDVFRPPATYPLFFSVLVGNGVQIGVTFFLFVTMCALGLVNPLRRGESMTAILVLFFFAGGIVSGYVSSRLFKFCGGTEWKKSAALSALGLPSILLTIFGVFDLFLSCNEAASADSAAVCDLLLLWLVVSVPLCFLGGCLGYRQEKLTVPVDVNPVARSIPDMPWYRNPLLVFLAGGILPYAAVFVEFTAILDALWLAQFYCMTAYLLPTIVMLVVTCAEVSLVMTYFQLCAGDHVWWWRSFGNCASAGFYILLHSLWFGWFRLDLAGGFSVVEYLLCSAVVSFCFVLFCGSVGTLGSFLFLRKIYRALKVDYV